MVSGWRLCPLIFFIFSVDGHPKHASGIFYNEHCSGKLSFEDPTVLEVSEGAVVAIAKAEGRSKDDQ